MDNKHAYMIMAHNNWHQLAVLLELLDDVRNDIYIHIDKKSGKYPENMLKDIVKQSNLYFIKRKKVYWADYSQVDVELDLMEAASKNNYYKYYHLISGMDLPLKTQDEIHTFFRDKTCEFIPMIPLGYDYVENHICYYHLFISNSLFRNYRFIRFLDNSLVWLQKKLKMKRVYDKDLVIAVGWNWFSITDEFCRYVLQQRNFVKKMFSFTRYPDEKIMGTMINKWGRPDRVYKMAKPGESDDLLREACLRYIDFDKPNPRPYTWGREDTQKEYDQLINSGFLFARKFDERVNFDIINMIAQELKKKSGK